MLHQDHGGDIYSMNCRIDFSANVNPLGAPDSVKAAVSEAAGLSYRYPDAQCRELREALSKTYHLPPDWFLCGNGASELILAAALALRPGRALLAVPCFSEYERALRNASCQDIIYYHCDPGRGFVTSENILDYISPDVDMVYLCNPANPTGLLTEKSLMRKIAARCRDCGTVLVLDECFISFLENPERATLAGEVSENPNLLILNAFTKTYAMAGLRLGYGITSDRKLAGQIREVLPAWNVSVPAQMAGIAALKETVYVMKARKLVHKELAYLKENLAGLGFTVYDSQANYLFFKGPENLAKLCSQQGILIRDCSSYRGLGSGYFRTAVKTRQENDELLRCMEAAVKRA